MPGLMEELYAHIFCTQTIQQKDKHIFSTVLVMFEDTSKYLLHFKPEKHLKLPASNFLLTLDVIIFLVKGCSIRPQGMTGTLTKMVYCQSACSINSENLQDRKGLEIQFPT